MDIRGFQVWLSAARGLTRAQRREVLAVLSGRSEGEASKAAIELGVDEARRCPHCASEGAVSRGMARGLRRYQCKGCGRTFNALSGTPLSGLHHKERWLSFGASLAKGETVKASAARCDVAVSTAFRWRHRFLAAARSDSEVLKGIVEADETYVLESRKGARGLGRKARRRGGKAKKRISREQVPVLMAADRSGTTVSAVLPRVDAAALTAALDPVVAKDALLVSDGGASYPPCAAALGVSHEALNRSMGERVRGDLHVQTVNSRHSREGLPASSPWHRHPLSRQLPELVPPRWPRPRRQRPGLPRRRRDEVTHTIHELSLAKISTDLDDEKSIALNSEIKRAAGHRERARSHIAGDAIILDIGNVALLIEGFDKQRFLRFERSGLHVGDVVGDDIHLPAQRALHGESDIIGVVHGVFFGVLKGSTTPPQAGSVPRFESNRIRRFFSFFSPRHGNRCRVVLAIARVRVVRRHSHAGDRATCC